MSPIASYWPSERAAMTGRPQTVAGHPVAAIAQHHRPPSTRSDVPIFRLAKK
jgi:hypothetical protein